MRRAWITMALALWAVGCDDGGEATSPAPDMQGGAADEGPTPDAQPDATPDLAPADDGVPADEGPPPADAGPDLAPDLGPDMAPECPECPGAQTCDEAAGACVEPAQCGADEDCFDGRHCAAGACTDDCLEDAVCPGSRVCDLDTGRCAEPAMCFADADCDPGRYCADDACTDACSDEAPCPGAQVCQPDGRCADAAVCEADADCAGDRICSGGACAEACGEDADCPGTRSCDLNTGRCPEPAECFVALDCDAGRVCVDGACQGQCGGDADCPGAQACDAGQCVEPLECGADLDCRGDRLCVDGACADPCGEDADCPGASRCNLDSGRCEGGAPACQRDRDCADGELCLAGACLPVQCETNLECADACVDRRCADGPPAACVLDGECGFGACAPAGVCAVEGPCQADDDCPAAAPLCAAGACVGCALDADCAPTEFCQAGRCALFGPCMGDADCPGTRLCADGACVPAPGCAGDPFDGPGRPPELAERSYTGLVACDGDEDVYRVTVAADEGLLVRALTDDPSHAPTVWITGAGQAAELARAFGPYGLATTGLLPVPAERDVDVHVTGPVGADAGYALTLDRLRDGACVPDQAEGPFGNDTQATADAVGPDPRLLRLCPGDEDWLVAQVPGAVELTATLSVGDLPDAATARLVGPDGAELAQAEVDGRALVARAVTGEAGAYALQVSLADGATATTAEVRLSTAATDGSAAAACAAPPALALGEAVPLPRGLQVDSLQGSCAEGLGALDRVYRLSLPAAATVRITVEPDDRQTAISVRRACADPQTEAECAVGPALGPTALAAGDWFVVVESGGFTPQVLRVDAVD